MHESALPATPFGRRAVSLGHIASQVLARKAREEAATGAPSNRPNAVHKWQLFRVLTEVRQRLGVSDRSLGVLNALLTFHPETALTLAPGGGDAEGEPAGLIVFPSNRALAARANGMDDRTLRRHLAALADAGLVIRRDSPNGKRYARRAGHDAPAQAFGFDLTPLVARAAQFESLAEEIRRDARQEQMLREKISLHRRDIVKLIALGLDEELPGDWESLRLRFMALALPLRSGLALETLRGLESSLNELATEATTLLEGAAETKDMSANGGDFVRHQSNSNTQHLSDLEPASKNAGGEVLDTKAATAPAFNLGMVLEACPDIVSYHHGPGGIHDWRDFVMAARTVRPMLGVSPSAWEEAVAALGEASAAVTLAAVLQRSEFSSEASHTTGNDGRLTTTINGSPAIRSPGGYLRSLTEKAGEGGFALGPLLMALIGQRLKVKRGGGSE
jgi:replication initiation protein RepC